MAQEFIHLNGPNGFQPGAARRPDGPPHLPQQGHPQMYPQGHAGAPSAPPKRAIPVDLRGGPAIQISDVSRDLLSESDMRGELTEYAVFRFEKMTDKDAFDDHGRPKHPSWDTAIRTEDRSISKQVAADKIRQLNQSSKNVVDKKGSLPVALKRQIDRALEDLIIRESDPANYQWSLAQIDHQLKPIAYAYPNVVPSQQGHRTSTAHRSSTKQKSRSRSGSHSSSSRHNHHHHHHHQQQPNVAYERVSLSAYFKRVPTSEADIPRMWREKKRGQEGMYRPNQGNPHGTSPPGQPMPPQFQGPPQGVREPGPMPMRGPGMNMNPSGPNIPPPGNMPPQNTMPPAGNMPHPNNMPPRPGGPPQHNGMPGQQQMQRGPVHGMRPGDSDSDSGSASTASRRGTTPPSSISDKQGGVGARHKDRNPFPARNGPGGFPRRSPSPHHPSRAPVPPHPLSCGEASVASHMERIREAAYRRGREDARFDEELGRRRSRSRRAYPPRSDGSADVIGRFFANLSMDDDEDDEDDDYDAPRYHYRHVDAARREEAREFKRRLQHGSILEGDPFERSVSPSSYGYTTDARVPRRRF
ncbi:hypothetical protein F4861DRAFT_179738 [Xylaria intraflava]|nr:hypothetical protein F4861DRAFT_179738 [Xylaria intraflava]